MKLKNLSIAFSLLVLNMSCQNMSNFTTSKLSDMSKSFESDENNCPSEKGFKIKSDDDLPIQTPTTPEEAEKYGIDFRNAPDGKYSGIGSSVKEVVNHSNNLPVPKGIRTGGIVIIFENKSKIRLLNKELNRELNNKKIKKDGTNQKINKEEEELKFISQDVEEKQIKSLNSIFDKANITGYFDFSDTEEELSKKSGEKDNDVESIKYYVQINVEESDIEGIISNLRKLSSVRQVNYQGYNTSVPDYIPNDEIFHNESQKTFGGQKASADVRYMYSRINAYDGWTTYNSYKDSQNIANVAVIDKGFFYTYRHEDSPDYLQGVVCDQTHNGGTNVCINSSPDYDPLEILTEHGEWVSSVIASPENNKGVTGIAYNSKILPIKWVGDAYSVSNVEKAIKYVVDNRATNKVKVINISSSWITSARYTFASNGATATETDYNNYVANNALPKVIRFTLQTTPVEDNGLIKNQITYAKNNGILVVITAGNQDGEIGTASNYVSSSALVVGGTSKYTNTRWVEGAGGGSSYGTRVDLAAPSQKIVFPSRVNTSIYTSENGTSYAAPQVAGTAALLMSLSNRPDLRDGTPESVDKVKRLLIYSSTPIQTDKPLGKIVRDGTYTVPNGKMLNVNKALDLAVRTGNGKQYGRIFNADAISRAIGNPSGAFNEVYYKEDKIFELPTGTGFVNFSTYNYGCAYSWGYQVWNQSTDVIEYVAGIAGKRLPLQNSNTGQVANSVENSWISNFNSGINKLTPDKYIINY